MTYVEKELAAIARREHNSKRTYLVVNPLQGKHVPVRPKKAFHLFQELGEMLRCAYQGETLLLVGFAETATAIGAAIAACLDSYYIQTTREEITGVSYLYFSESHSHATEQKLVREDIEQVIGIIDRVIFIEDEVTTGNTILNIIDIMEREYPDQVKFSVASLLNGMNPESMERYHAKEICLHYLVKTNHDSYTEIAEGYKGNGKYHKILEKHPMVKEPKTYGIGHYIDARRMTRGQDYEKACMLLWKEILKKEIVESGQRILVLGTEEFMYPAFYIGMQLERDGRQVKCHATTRSPIVVSREADYPLQERYELSSLYEEERRTYVYNLSAYDQVLVVTDAREKDGNRGLNSLLAALESCKNDNISIVRWGCDEKFL